MDEPNMRQLTNDERKRLASKQISMLVNPFEAEIIKQMRKYTHGRFIVHLLDGIPVRYELGVSYMLFEETDGEATLNDVLDIQQKKEA